MLIVIVFTMCVHMHPCHLCGKHFSRLYSLKRHINETHTVSYYVTTNRGWITSTLPPHGGVTPPLSYGRVTPTTLNMVEQLIVIVKSLHHLLMVESLHHLLHHFHLIVELLHHHLFHHLPSRDPSYSQEVFDERFLTLYF